MDEKELTTTEEEEIEISEETKENLSNNKGDD